MLFRALLLGVVHAGAAFAGADDFPARFDVIGPAADIRAAPQAAAPVLGQRGGDDRGVQVITASEDGAWAQIAYGDGAGWVPMDRLARQNAPSDQSLPLRCYGVEPFWGLHLPAPFFAEFERPEHPEIPFQVTGTDDQLGPGGRTRLWTFMGDTASASLLMRHEACTDGMSDRPFGLSAAFTLIENTGAVHLRLGCCSLTNP